MFFHRQVIHVDDDRAAFENAHCRTIGVGVIDLEFAALAFSAVLLESLEHAVNSISYGSKKFL